MRDRLMATWVFRAVYSFPHTLRYLVVGGFNVVFGYIIFLACYYVLERYLNYLVIYWISFMISLTSALIMQRFLVFDSRAPWIPEYYRFFLVNISGAGLNMVLLFLFKQMDMNIPLAQGIATLVVVIISYLGHLKFTFRKDESDTKNEH